MASKNVGQQYLFSRIRQLSKIILTQTHKNFCTDFVIKKPATDVQKTVKIAVIGVPNAGKSTFINNLINHRVCPTSSKVHTTRKANIAISTVKDTQIMLYDTPGLVTNHEIKKHNLENSFKSSYRHSIQHSNIIAVIHDTSNTWTRNELHSTVLDTLNAYPKVPSFLVLNKIDKLKSKRFLLELIRTLTKNTLSSSTSRISKIMNRTSRKSENTSGGWSNFSDVFMVSAITGDGLDAVMNYILRQANPGKWEYPQEIFTDESPEDLIVQSVRARLLDYLPQEIPYFLRSELEYYSSEKDAIYASVQVSCPSARLEKLLCGESNGKLKQITERVTSDLVETFGKPISLTISTSVKKTIVNKV